MTTFVQNCSLRSSKIKKLACHRFQTDILAFLIEQRGNYQEFLEKVCDLVQRQDFTLGLIDVGLLIAVNETAEYSDMRQHYNDRSDNLEAVDTFGPEV
jgi:hypothetical protein